MQRLLVALAASTLLLGACGSDPATTSATTSSAHGSTTSRPPGEVDATTTSTAAASSTTVAASVSDGALDATVLPIGDGKVTSAPTVGSVFACQTSFPSDAPGGFATGDWFDATAGTFDATTKPTVDGAVPWPDATFEVTLEGDQRSVVGNDLPNHPTGTFPVAADDDAYDFDRNPNAIAAQDLAFTLPSLPEVADEPTCLGMGAIGVLTTGTWVFDALDAGGNDAVAHEIQDSCDGHPEQRGGYHYHSLSRCATDDGVADDAGHSGLVGYARDGFGIFGPRDVDGTALATEDLDECHGHTHAIEWDGAQIELYHYHATADYPYTLSCYRGTPT